MVFFDIILKDFNRGCVAQPVLEYCNDPDFIYTIGMIKGSSLTIGSFGCIICMILGVCAVIEEIYSFITYYKID